MESDPKPDTLIIKFYLFIKTSTNACMPKIKNSNRNEAAAATLGEM